MAKDRSAPIARDVHFMCPLCKTHQSYQEEASIEMSEGIQQIECDIGSGGCGEILFATIQWDVRFKNIYTLQEHFPDGKPPLGLT